MRVLMSEALPFDGPVRVGSHHIARGFMDGGHALFWLGGTYHVGSLLLGHAEARRAFGGPLCIGPSAWTHHPVTLLPFRARAPFDSRAVLERSLDFAMPAVRSVLSLYGFDAPDVLWLSQCPSSAVLPRLVRARRVVYRMSDRYAAFGGVPAAMADAESALLERADLVLVTARVLLEALPASVRAKAHYLPNAVDVAHFAAQASEPADLASVPHPRAVFVGSLSEWVDLHLVASVARALPSLQLVLIGPAGAALDGLAGFTNVHILGPRAYADLPAYLRHADVALIPFVKSALTDAVCPVKLFEYFAAGLPVVATRLTELERLESPALLASGAEEFVAQIERALGGGAAGALEFAGAHTWRERLTRILSLLE